MSYTKFQPKLTCSSEDEVKNLFFQDGHHNGFFFYSDITIFSLIVHTKSNCFLASGDFCHLLITFANSLDPDQDGHSVHPELDRNHLTG